MLLASQRDTCIILFIAIIFKIAKIQNQHRCPSTDEEIRKCDLQTQWNTFQPK
jgi:hypothetical protein